MTDGTRDADGAADDFEWFDQRYGAPDVAGAERGTSAEPARADASVDDGDLLVVQGEDGDAALPAAVEPGRGEPTGVWANPLVARILRRPRAWWNAPWDNARTWRLVVTVTSLCVTTVIMMLIVHFNP